MPGDPVVHEGVSTTLTAADFLNTVAVKLPLFWPENIKTWFIQSESQIHLTGMSVSQTKFDYCVQSMTQEIAMKVPDLMMIPTSISRTGCYLCFALYTYEHVEAIANLPLLLLVLPFFHS